MGCQQFQPLISAYVDRELIAVDSLRVRQHLAECAACSAEAAQIQGVRSLMLEMAPTPEPRVDFDTFIARQRPAPPRRFAVSLAIACVAVIASELIPVMSKTVPPSPQKRVSRDMSREVAREQMLAAESDPTSGASLVHFANFSAK